MNSDVSNLMLWSYQFGHFIVVMGSKSINIVVCFSPRENSSVTVMWSSYYAAKKKPETSTDGLHYGQSITTLVINCSVVQYY